LIFEQDILDNPKLIALLPTAAFTTDQEGRVLFFNEEAARLWGYNPEFDKTASDRYCLALRLYRLDGSPLAHDEGPMARTLKTSQPVRDFEFIIERPDASRISIQVNTTPIYGRNKEILGAIATFQDTSERRNATEVLERASDAFFAVDYRLTVRGANGAALAFMKKSREELMGSPLSELFPEAEGSTGESPFLVQCQETLKNQGRCRFEKFHHALAVWVEVTVYPSFAGLSVYFRDITERRRAEELLKESENRFRRIAIKKELLAEASEQLSSSLEYRKNMAHLLDLLVPRLCEGGFVLLLDDSGQRLLTECRMDDDDKKNSLEALIAEAYADQKSFLFEAIRSRKTLIQNHIKGAPDKTLADGKNLSDFMACGSLVMPLILENRVIGIIGLLSLQPERVFDEEDVDLLGAIGNRASVSIHNAILYEGAQKAILARDDLMSICSHEIRTPITSMRLHAGLAKRAMMAPPHLFKFVHHMEQQIDRLVRLVNDMLDFSRIQSGHFKIQLGEVSVSELLRDVVDRLLPRFNEVGCEVIMNVAPDIFVSGDSFRLEQVVVNLLTNSIRYGYGKPVEIGLGLKSGIVELFVKDYGRGISPGDHKRIFLKFERAISDMNISGLGLGLFIAREIMEAHQGTIRLESELGKGAKFIVTLPELSSKEHFQDHFNATISPHASPSL
jgi:signal transduction histidine kinase